MRKLNYLFLIAVIPILLHAQSDITGSATVRVIDGGTLCNGAAAVVDIYVDVTGLTGFQSQPAGLNAFQIKFSVENLARSFFANALSASNEAVVFSVKASNKSNVSTSGNLTIAGWTSGDTPNRDYLVGKLVFSGSPTAGSGSITPLATGSLASKWWDDGSANGDGPSLITYSVQPALSITVPLWPGLTLLEGCSLWGDVDSQYDFSSPADIVDLIDLIDLMNCGAPIL